MINEPVLQPYFEGLDAGKLLTTCCTDCGHVQFPPAPVCQKCEGMKMEWRELSGEGELILLMCFAVTPNERFRDFGKPSFIGSVRLREGPGYTAHIGGLEGIGVDDMEAEIAKLPRPVKLAIETIGGQKTITFNVM